MFKIKVRIFGAFRKYFEAPTLEITLEEQVTVSSFKQIFQKNLKALNCNFNEDKLVEESAIASEDEILTDNFIINQIMNLAILPPVCGG
ncbi:MAG: MoaD/ThiS family protein [Bacteriovoracaceae bacterium]